MNEPAQEGWIPWPYPSPFLNAIGGFSQFESNPLRAGFVVSREKVNGRGFLHGGAIAAIGDVVIGHAVARQTNPPARLLTINLSCDLVGTAQLDEWVEVTVTPTRIGKRLGAGTATFHTDRPIATVTGLFIPSQPG